MTTEIVPIHGAALFASENPRAFLATAREYAAVLGDVLRERNLVRRIGESEHVLIEGWTFLAGMTGAYAVVEYSRPLVDADLRITGYEARATAHSPDGTIRGAADGMCTRNEYAWKNRDDYALRSMAQTRAVSQALRRALGFIVELAGYNATPAEEMPLPEVGGRRRDVPARGAPSTERELRAAIEATRQALGLTNDDLERLAKSVGISGRATKAQLRLVLDRLLIADRVPIPTDDDLPDIPEQEGTTDHDDNDASDDDAEIGTTGED